MEEGGGHLDPRVEQCGESTLVMQDVADTGGLIGQTRICPSKVCDSPRAKFYAVNLKSELDSPGEYFIDRDEMLIYFWPPGDLDTRQVTSSPLLSCGKV
eukprot:541890-Hanusia_phi.AAC.1